MSMGLAWSAYYEEEDADAERYLAETQKHINEIASAEIDIYEQEWLELTTLDMESFRMALDETKAE